MSQDPLDTKVDDIDISYPIIPAGLYDLVIDKVSVEENKDKDGKNFVLSLKTQSPVQSIKGNPVAAGFQLTYIISLKESEKYTLVDIGKRIATVAKAAGVFGVSPRDIINDPTRLKGRVVTAKVQVSQERTDPRSGRIYEPRSEIASFVVKK